MLGFFVMLPNDLENHAQSAIATNLFGNNILQVLTLSNYWALSNEYKPLMYTWSLGVEEQFYLIYPLLFMVFTGKRLKFLLPLIVLLTVVSALLFFRSTDSLKSFYLLQYRFFELAIGGLGAIVFGNRHISKFWTIPAIFLLLAGLLTRFNISRNYYLVMVFDATFLLLVIGSNDSKMRRLLVENTFMVYLGKIIFSIYMWHQIVMAFARYIFIDHFGYAQSGILIGIMIGLSALTYTLVEKPFRNAAYIYLNADCSVRWFPCF